LTEKM